MAAATKIKGLENIKAILETGMVKQLIFMFCVAIGVAVGIVLYMSISEPVYQPLDYQVTQQNMASIVDTLEKSNILYKINDRDGILMVPAKDLQMAKLKLSAAGIPKDDGFNYGFLNEQNSLGNTQFVENARYLRALENDLSKTISAIEGISGAKVHIAIPQNNVFADENNKPTASVMLSIAAATASDKEKIRSIMQMVADSVPGLDPKNVAITDQYGHFLSEGLDDSSITNLQQLNQQNTLQNYYEKRIEAIVAPIVGQNKVTVRVNAEMDFTQQEDAAEQYTPDAKAIRSEQSTTEDDSSGGASGAPGSLSNAPPEESSGSQSSASSGSHTRSQSVKNYELGRTVSYKRTNFAKVKSLSVAVVVDNQSVYNDKTKKMEVKPLDKEMITKITDLVKATVGYNETRGDTVTVINTGYTESATDLVTSKSYVWDHPWFWEWVKRITGIMIGFIFLFILYRRLSTYMKSTPTMVQKNLPVTDEEDENTGVEMQQLKQERMNRLKQLAATEPNKVALVIKNWVGKQ